MWRLFQQPILSLMTILPRCVENQDARITDYRKAVHLMFQGLQHLENNLKNTISRFFSKSIFLPGFSIPAIAANYFNCSTKYRRASNTLPLKWDLQRHKPLQEVHAKKSFVMITRSVLPFLKKEDAEILDMQDLLCPDSELMWQSLLKRPDGRKARILMTQIQPQPKWQTFSA